ncbi:MAG: hypothetical protein LBR11_06865 [Deltaproteobacteria bacterium]|jgi:biopolymer transport protein ExbB/TolQ|nr:hypothetical protein [Deltaproteobacteria bacterium]
MGSFSRKGMFLDADPVVQRVMVLLFLASLASWVVILAKTALLRKVSRIEGLYKQVANNIDDEINLEDFPNFTVKIVSAGIKEGKDTVEDEPRSDYQERVERSRRFQPL